MAMNASILWLPLLVACGPAEDPKPVGSLADEPPEDSGQRPLDSGDPDTGTAPPVPTVGVSLEAESVACAEPDLRSVLGPMQLHEPGGDWGAQNGAENLWSLYGGAGMAVADFDGDARLDVFLPNADGDQLYMGRSDTSFSNESSLRLPAEDDVGVGATAVDADGDGDLDIFVAVHLASNRLLLNDGSGHFQLAEAAWLENQTRLSHGSSWADVDGDGDLDAFVAHYGNWDEGWLVEAPSAPDPDSPPNDAFWLNQGGGSFVNADDQLGSMSSAGAFTFASGFWDIDDDGDPDLIASNDYRFEYDWAEPVRLLVNEGGVFEDADPLVGLDLEVEGMGLAVGELNGDGQLDVAIQAWSTHLMMSDGTGQYVESAASKGIVSSARQEVGWGIAMADLNNDGRLDLPVSYGLLPPDEVSMGPMPEFILGDQLNMNWVRQPDALYVQDSEGYFSDAAPEWGVDHDGISRGLLAVDFNRDGFLDLISRDLWGPARIHMSRCDASGWLMVQLKQEGPNPFAIGAKLTITAGEHTHTRFIEAGSSSVSSGGPPVAHVGLGAVDVIDRIEVRWPDGARSLVEDVQARARVRLTRD